MKLNQSQRLRQRVEAGEHKAALARDFAISRETLYQYLRDQPPSLLGTNVSGSA